MFGMGMPEILLILAIALIVIGPKKLPELAKSLGRALGEFKSATSDLKESMQIDHELADVKDAFDQLNSDDDKKEKPSAEEKKPVADTTSENASEEDKADGANKNSGTDLSGAPPFSSEENSGDKDSSTPRNDESTEMTDASQTVPVQKDTAKADNVPVDPKPADHQDVFAQDEKTKEL